MPGQTQARLVDGLQAGLDLCGAIQPSGRRVVVIPLGRQFGLPDDRAFGRCQPLLRTGVAWPELECGPELRDRTIAVTATVNVDAEPALVERLLAPQVSLFSLHRLLDRGEVGFHRGIGRREF